MGIHRELINHDEVFHSLKTKPMIINSFDTASAAEVQRLNELIYTTHSGDVMDDVPRCRCGATEGNANKGLICPEPTCGTVVETRALERIETTIWFKTPEGIESLVNLNIWGMLERIFSTSNFSYIQWLTNPRYDPHTRPIDKVLQIQSRLKDAGIGMGYNNFIRRFDDVVQILYEVVSSKEKNKREDALELMAILKWYSRDYIFPNYLPLPNRSMFVLEETNSGGFTATDILNAVTAIRSVAGIDAMTKPQPISKKEVRVSRFLTDMYLYQVDQNDKVLKPKQGLCRKQIFGCRDMLSFRAVVNSITEEHEYFDCHIPWSIGIVLLRYQLMNKLEKRGYSPRAAKTLLDEHTKVYHPLLDALFEELIDESPYRGLPFLLQRNPSLGRGSIQSLFITKVKKDVNNPTISMSILIVRGFNADFDGKLLIAVVKDFELPGNPLEPYTPSRYREVVVAELITQVR